MWCILLAGAPRFGAQNPESQHPHTRDPHMAQVSPTSEAAYEQITASEGELREQLVLHAESESRAKESEEKYRDLFENSVVGIFRTTPEGKFSAINTTFARIAGYDSPQEMMEAIADIRTQLYVNLEDRDLFVNALKTDGFVKDFEAQYYHRDGHTVWILINAKVVFNLQGGVRYYEGTIEDKYQGKTAAKIDAKFDDDSN